MSTAMSDDFKLIKVGLRDWETPENRYAAQRSLDRVKAAYADLLAAQPEAVPDGWRAFLCQLERCVWHFDQNGDIHFHCPVCESAQDKGHSEGCKMAAMLAVAPSPAQGERSDMQFGNVDAGVLPAETRFELGLIDPPSPAAEGAKVDEGWIRAIDEAMVVHHVGVADAADSYETAKDKLNRLLCCAQDIGALHARPAEVLSDEQIASCFPCGGGMNEYGEVVVTPSWLNEFARAVQRAVLAQPSGVDDGL